LETVVQQERAIHSPRFSSLPLDLADQITLLIFAEALANLYQTLIERTAGRPVACELVEEIRAIVAKAEFDGRVAVMNRLEEAA
jgi:hypothetical protein